MLDKLSTSFKRCGISAYCKQDFVRKVEKMGLGSGVANEFPPQSLLNSIHRVWHRIDGQCHSKFDITFFDLDQRRWEFNGR